MANLSRRVWLLPFAVATLIAVSAGPAGAQQAGPFFIDGNPLNGSGVPTSVPADDIFGSNKELGPVNGNDTKVGVIHSAPPPMLALTNPNGQVDLTKVYTQTAKAASGDLWYYFAWTRDANSGSGFISIEFQQADLSAACKVAYTNATCNPWSGRQAGDFMLLWDQSGGSTEILKRVFSGTAPALTLGTASPLGSAVARFSADGFSGELAINLTTDVFPASGVCVNFANILPGTVTGNSDQADYKDAVLSPFPDVKNCGGVTVTKKTVPAGLSGTFVYTLQKAAGPIFPTSSGGVIQKDSDCTTNSDTQCIATLTTDGDKDTIEGLLEGTDYDLDEDPGTGFTLTSIVCTLGTTTYTDAPFPVVAGQTTDCVITNTVLKGTPAQNTVQAGVASISDQINLSSIRAHSSNTSASVTFKLYSDASCTSQVGSDMTRSLTYGTVDPATNTRTATANTSSTPLQILPGVVYYWRVTYSGDDLNNGFTTPCGQETASVTFTFVQ